MKLWINLITISILAALTLYPLAHAYAGLQQLESRKVVGIEFIGNEFFDSDSLRNSLRLVKLGDRWNPGTLEASIEKDLKAFLKQHGFARCQAQLEDAVNREHGVWLRIRISEGAQYRISKLDLKDFTVFAKEHLLSQFSLGPGDIVDFSQIKEGLNRIRRMYADKGYLDMSYLPEQDFDEARQTMALTLTFVEEMPYYVGYVAFIGCEQADENLARSVVLLRTGNLFRSSDVDGSIDALNKLGLFQKVDEEACVITPDHQERGRVHIQFWLKPKLSAR